MGAPVDWTGHLPKKCPVCPLTCPVAQVVHVKSPQTPMTCFSLKAVSGTPERPSSEVSGCAHLIRSRAGCARHHSVQGGAANVLRHMVASGCRFSGFGDGGTEQSREQSGLLGLSRCSVCCFCGVSLSTRDDDASHDGVVVVIAAHLDDFKAAACFCAVAAIAHVLHLCADAPSIIFGDIGIGVDSAD